MPQDLASLLRAEIASGGPMRVRRWMEVCLYHPESGYYMRPGRKTGTGPDADFATPPTLHPFFGRAVAREIRDLLHGQDRATIVEYGGGEGDLALHALAELEQEPAVDASWGQVEVSPEHAKRQAGRHPRMRPVPPGSPADVGVFCEVLDAVPCDILDADGVPVRVQCGPAGTGAFRFTSQPHQVVGSDQAAWLAARAASLAHALVVDYGEDGPAGTLRGYRRHAPTDPLQDPGEVDITASVDFCALRQAMSRAGFVETGFESLESFLLRHGILEELNAIDRGTVQGASSYLRLRQLLLPTGLGAAFKVACYTRL